jgi:hypothetical protein
VQPDRSHFKIEAQEAAKVRNTDKTRSNGQ